MRGNAIIDNVGLGLGGSFTSTPVVAYGRNQLNGNNGGNANPQVANGVELAPDVSGSDLTCP